MAITLPFLLDLAAIAVLTLGLYYPRHRRRDLVAAFLGVNIGVLAVAAALTSTGVSAGLGLGLFGVLSIIRLRSAELEQQEIAYYFASLALGLLGGISTSPAWLTPALMVAVLGAMYLGDHPALFARQVTQQVVLDRAFTDRTALVAHLEQLLGGHVDRVSVRKLDLVADTTQVDVRYRLPAPARDDLSAADVTVASRGGAR